MAVSAIETIGLTLAISVALLAGTVEDHSDEHAQAASLADAIKAEAQEFRRDRAARAICGENAGYRFTNKSNEIVCLTKRGHVTKTKGTL